MVKIIKAQDVINYRNDVTVDGSLDDASSVGASCDDEIQKQLRDSVITKAKIEANKITSKALNDSVIIISKTKRDSEAMLKEAMEESGRLLEEARENGYNQGLKDCEEQVNYKLEAAEKEARDIVENAYKERDEILLGLKDEVLSLSLNISEKILKIELDRNDEAFRSIVLEAINKVAGNNDIKVRVGEEDYERYFSGDKGEEIARSNNMNITFIKDRALNNGDCFVDSDCGSVDASVNTQFAQVKVAFGVNA